MRPTQCAGGLYLTVADLLAPMPVNNNDIVHKKGEFRQNFGVLSIGGAV